MMTIKKYKNSISATLLAFIMVFAGSCTKDLLDPTPTTSIIDNEAFDNPARILLQVNGLYAGVRHGEFYGGRYIIYNEIRGEEFIVNKPNGVTGLDTWGQNVNSNTNEVVNLWSRAYAAINRANVFLAGLQANSSKVDATLASQYTGEAEFLRALSYLALVQTYAKPYVFDNGASLGVPLRLVSETTLTGGGTNDLARSTVAEVYAQILKDLDDAEAKLPATPVNGAFRAYKNTAIALKARVYLTHRLLLSRQKSFLHRPLSRLQQGEAGLMPVLPMFLMVLIPVRQQLLKRYCLSLLLLQTHQEHKISWHTISIPHLEMPSIT